MGLKKEKKVLGRETILIIIITIMVEYILNTYPQSTVSNNLYIIVPHLNPGDEIFTEW